MKYMLLIYGDYSQPMGEPGSPEFDAMMGEYITFTNAVSEAGIMGASEELDDPATARTLRVRGGESLLSDGPFIESKEQLGGFYIIDVESIEDAAKWAAQIPDARTGAIEIRPVMERDYSEFGE